VDLKEGSTQAYSKIWKKRKKNFRASRGLI